MNIKSKLRFLGMLSVTILLLAGCSYHSGNRGGMMGTSTTYYSSKTSCNFPTDLSGTIVRVTLGDMGMTQMMGGIAPRSAHMRLVATPSSIPSGTISVEVANYGWRTHELVILPLAHGKNAGQRVPGVDGKVDEAGSLGEASTDCGSGAGDGVKAGSATWTTVVLKPGRYEFVCNLQNHYQDGMYQEVDVV